MKEDFPFTVITAEGTFKGRFAPGERDVLEVREEVLTPNYEQTAKFLGTMICEGRHEKPALALSSFTEQIRYLTQTDLPAVQRVVEYFDTMQKNVEAEEVGGEDSHLEAQYEDRHGYPEDENF